MEFRLDEEELRRFAQIEEEANCDISTGVDWGSYLGGYLAQINETVDDEKRLLNCYCYSRWRREPLHGI